MFVSHEKLYMFDKYRDTKEELNSVTNRVRRKRSKYGGKPNPLKWLPIKSDPNETDHKYKTGFVSKRLLRITPMTFFNKYLCTEKSFLCAPFFCSLAYLHHRLLSERDLLS